jgi:hypothetical protein
VFERLKFNLLESRVKQKAFNIRLNFVVFTAKDKISPVPKQCEEKMTVFRVVAPCSLAEVNRHFISPEGGGSKHL